MRKNDHHRATRIADTTGFTVDETRRLIEQLSANAASVSIPPTLGLTTSVEVSLKYFRTNVTQATLAEIYETSQSTISPAISAVCSCIDDTLPHPPGADDLHKDGISRHRRHPGAVLELVRRPGAL